MNIGAISVGEAAGKWESPDLPKAISDDPAFQEVMDGIVEVVRTAPRIAAGVATITVDLSAGGAHVRCEGSLPRVAAR